MVHKASNAQVVIFIVLFLIFNIMPVTVNAESSIRFSAGDSKDGVEYTLEEEQLLDYICRTYAESVELFNSGVERNNGSIYGIEPKVLKTPLEAGEMNDKVVEAAAAILYINTIRIGSGLPVLALSDEITNAAQHKAALVVYLQSIGEIAGHNPSKPNGVSDDFYNTAMSYANENLYMAGFFTGHPITSIMLALHDGYGDPA